jgi:hypothetical protein
MLERPEVMGLPGVVKQQTGLARAFLSLFNHMKYCFFRVSFVPNGPACASLAASAGRIILAAHRF